MPRDALTIIENKSKVRTSRNKLVVSKVNTTTSSSSHFLDITALTDIVKELVLMNKDNQQASVKAVEETFVTCGGLHSLEEGLVSYFQNFKNTSESSEDSTNVVNAPREPFVVKQDHGVKSSQNPPPIDKCCCECGNALDGIFC
nr:hypothetical protein [Tanacetum cinerariifolium]